VCDLEVFAASKSVRARNPLSGRDALLIHIVLRDALSPDATLRISQLFQQRLSVDFEVFVDDDFRLCMSLRHLDWSPTEDRNTTDALLSEHVMEHRSANETGRACQDEVHRDKLLCLDVSKGSAVQ
jgi:hypothetical protein